MVFKNVTGAILILLLTFSSGVASLDAREMTSVDVSNLRSVSSIAISPSGDHVAYVVGVPAVPFVEESGPVRGELHVVDENGRSRAFVTEGGVSDAAWAADGKSIFFLAKRGDDSGKSLYRIGVDGGEAERVLSHPPGIGSFEISPDGKRCAFTVKEEVPDEITEINDLGFDAVIFEENLLDTRVWVADLENSVEAKIVELEGTIHSLNWVDDDTLVMAHAPTSLVDDSYVKRRIRFWNVRTGKESGRIENPGKLGAIRPAPSGGAVAAIAAADLNDPAEGRLILGDAGGEYRDLLPGLEAHVSAVEWLDSKRLMYVVDKGVGTSLETIGADGRGRRTVVSSDQWIIEAIAPARNGSVAMLIESATHPQEVYLLPKGAKQPRRLTNSNPWLSEVDLAPQEIVRFEARDGLDLEGILIRPLGQVKSRRYPLIMAVHGGPESHHQNGWMTSSTAPGQLAASKGYAVFYTNYRGSTGRGVAFSKLSQGDPAGKEFDDVIDAVDHLIEIGLADEDRVGITGGSYGGYATAWGATYYSERYRAAVMNVGISEKIAKFGTSDIPWELNVVHDRAWPWEEWKLMLERSPVYYVEKARTPILIMHGADDPRVHPTQSMILYRYLKVLNEVPVRLVLYPGEGHGNRKSAARLDYNLRMMRWFDHFLMGEGKELPPSKIEYPRSAFEK